MNSETESLIFYTDEDVDGPAIEIARKQDVPIVTANDAGLLAADDDAHFRYAIENGYILVTANIKHFPAMFNQWLADGHAHPGIVFITPGHRKNSVLIASVLKRLSVERPRAGMENRAEWI